MREGSFVCRSLMCFAPLLFIACWASESPVLGQFTDELEQSGAGAFIDPSDLDSLLDAVEQDIGQLTNVSVLAPALQTEVTTVSRQTSTVGRSPAAVFVLTNEMIRRSGARSVPEALRMVPGIHVARVNANQWAISIRGFNHQFANKLLVQIDGRTVYTPLFSGVFWDEQQVMLEDVDRIEIIRGPGATVWGANAVNGIISIITKRARDTHGAVVQGGGGTEQRGFGAARLGGTIGDSLHYRVYGQGFSRDSAFNPRDAQDEWHQGRVGARADWDLCEHTTLTVQGDYYEGTSGAKVDEQIPTPPFFAIGSNRDDEISGGNVIARLSRTLSEDSDWQVQVYYDRTERTADNVSFSQSMETFDLDAQHRFALTDHQSLIWGFGYRNQKSVTDGNFVISWDPPVRTFDRISYFVQDELAFRDDLVFTVGSKFEHGDLGGFQYQPTGRLLWLPTERHVVWGSVSRAVRTPSRTDMDLQVIGAPVAFSFAPPPPKVTFMQVLGNDAIKAEEVMAYEAGIRAQPHDDFWWDATVFFNKYRNLVATVPTTPFPPAPSFPPAFWDQTFANVMDGETYGFELDATYQVNPSWKLRAAYTYLQMQLHGFTDEAEELEGESPHNLVYAQSSWDIGANIQFDVMGRYVDSVPQYQIPSYVAMDIRLAWLPTDNLEMEVVGRNLLDSHHPEFSERSFYPSEIQSEVYGMVTWRR
ncbi:MAG: TonB-dependent receptor [Planctomycetes bacterium]|nr:TonB-dependent receptor [Planctomycetota bacterium]